MTYDFHGDWEQSVGHNSPLFPLNGASAYHKKLTVDFSVGEWHRKGAAKEKLVVGSYRVFNVVYSYLNCSNTKLSPFDSMCRNANVRTNVHAAVE